VPQQWWKLCRKVVHDMYIKWQYKWFGNKFLIFFFSIAHRNLLSGQPTYFEFNLFGYSKSSVNWNKWLLYAQFSTLTLINGSNKMNSSEIKYIFKTKIFVDDFRFWYLIRE
jgi:hypothetical protein